MKWSSKTARRWIRILHRDLGYLMVGLSLVYGISGYVLNHMDGSDPAFRTYEETITLQQNLDKNTITSEWTKQGDLPEIKTVLKMDDEHYRIMLDGGLGIYQINTGIVDYKCHTKRPFIYFINKLHYNKAKLWTWIGDIFAFSLIFFAISGLFMVKGKKGIKGHGKWYLIAGLTIPLIYLFWI